MSPSSTNSITLHLIFSQQKKNNHCSHEVMLKTKLTHTYTYYKFIQRHFIHSYPSLNPRHCFMFINSNYLSPYFLNFIYCIKSTNLHVILRNKHPVRQMYILCPLTNTFPQEDAHPIITPREYIQLIEVALQENIHKFKFNHTLYNLIQNSDHEFSATIEEVNIIRALKFLRPLLRTKSVIGMLAKF